MSTVATTNNESASLAAALPPTIRFGTSTWTYPGWKGTIYHREYKNDRVFRSESLREYAEHPLFRSVGIDSFFYTPPSAELLKSYAEMTPPGFKWVSKVWERLTIPKYPSHKRYGARAGQENTDFLNAELFKSHIAPAYRTPEVFARTGPFVFQFPTIARTVLPGEEFLSRLGAFLSALPPEFQYATEIRNPELLKNPYFETVNSAGATHCFNHWQYMPPLVDQMRAAAAAGGLTAPFYVARLLTPKGVSYEQAVKLFSPYDKLQRPNPEMRADVVRLVLRAVELERPAYVIVNNRCEGYAPGTITEISAAIVEALPRVASGKHD